MPSLSTPLAIVVFVAGVGIAIWAAERLLEGLVGLSRAVKWSTVAVGALLSGFEAENVAVGLAAGATNEASIALGTVFGGAIFLVCVALGLGGVLYPLRVDIPRRVLVSFVAAPLLSGIGLFGNPTPRIAGVVLLLIFAVFMANLVVAARGHRFLDPEEVEQALQHRHAWPASVGLTALGIVAISIGGDMVSTGATRIVQTLGVPVGLMGMVVAPAAIELEEIVRQAIPSRDGHPEVSAGNLIGTLFYFVLFNLGLIALATPVQVDPLVRNLDWPFLMVVTLVAAVLLYRGIIGRIEGGLLLLAYAVYVGLHVAFR